MGASSAGNKRAWVSSHFLWRGLGAIVLGVLLAKWSWVLFAPHTEAVFAVHEQGSGAESGRLFGAAAVAAAVPTPTVAVKESVAETNVRLVGVFAGSPGFAILELDGKRQVGIALGDEVVPGTRLLKVAADHVMLKRAGVRQRVDFEVKASDAAGVGVAPVR